MGEMLSAYADAREQFLALVAEVRPELHRYCARLAGSVVEGEDIVQDTLAKAIYALSLCEEVPVLRPWLFRIAHNAALDFLKSHGRSLTETRTVVEVEAPYQETPEPLVLRAALLQFLALPVISRSAVILKDVLGHSLEETAETMGSTVPAVKSALVRGRAALRAQEAPSPERFVAVKPELERYASLFNARDWDGVRAMIASDCSLDLVAKSQRRGSAVGMYFGRYAKEAVTLQPGLLDGAPVLAACVGEATVPSYFILLTFADGVVTAIRDFRYVPYIAAEARFTPSAMPGARPR